MFLLGCALTEIRLYNTQPHDVTELKLCNSFQIPASFFRKVSYFAKEKYQKLEELHKFEFCDVVWLRVVKADFRQGAA